MSMRPDDVLSTIIKLTHQLRITCIRKFGRNGNAAGLRIPFISR
jgi:hypothetical protein